jgi:outer membrane protein TolC
MEQGYSVQASQQVRKSHGWPRWVIGVVLFAGLLGAGCRSPGQHREKADRIADKIIAEKQKDAGVKTEILEIERPSDILRRRLIEVQDLSASSTASLGTDALKPIPHAPKDNYPTEIHSSDANIPIEPNEPLKIPLIDALQIAAHNSPDYQSQKERVFQAALSLDLARHSFRAIFAAGSDHSINMSTGDETVTTTSNGGSAGVDYLLRSGAAVSAAIGIDLLNLLTQGGASSMGLSVDTSVSVPLLRGAGQYIILEPLTQAERDMVYQLWTFERYKRTFAVNIASNYYNVLGQMDSLKNSEDNYRSAVLAARMSRRQGDAGRLPQIQVDQAVQSELRARSTWISADISLQNSLDSFKTLLGLPADARITLDANDLKALQDRGTKYVELMQVAYKANAAEKAPPADADVVLVPPSKEDAGPYEIDEWVAVQLALEHRLDLRVANGAVYDAQRQVIMAADALRTGLTLNGGASLGGSPGGARGDDVGLDFRKARYSALLALDLPIDRTRQRNDYRNSLIGLEQATRAVQTTEDQIKTAIRSELRALLKARENLKINAQSVVIAENSYRNESMLLEAGRVLMRDLLEAQDARLSAQNGLTNAVVQYRITELQLQRDLDMLEITEKGFKELTPEDMRYDI